VEAIVYTKKKHHIKTRPGVVLKGKKDMATFKKYLLTSRSSSLVSSQEDIIQT